MIYHITTSQAWAAAQEHGHYRTASLDDEGFIHCSTLEQVCPVANAFYRSSPHLILLCIDDAQVQATIKWEAPAHPDGDSAPKQDDVQQFPHIYGVLNTEAVVKTLVMPKRDGATPYHLDDLEAALAVLE